MLPPIRYPLPTLLLILAIGLIAWRGEPMTRPLRSSLAERWQRRFEGPPIPHSTRPQRVVGPIVSKALLLHDDVPTSDRPGGSPSDTIRLRMFVDIYDVWPLTGSPAFYRIGNRRPIGWADARDLLPWPTRLVVRSPAGAASKEATRPALPVLSWTSDSIEVATWEESVSWQAVKGQLRIPIASLRPEDWGVWISRQELLGLLRKTEPDPSEPAEVTRLRAIIGRLSDDRPLAAKDLAAARAYLPAAVFSSRDRASSLLDANKSLARANERWKPEAAWGGLSFQFLPLSALP